MTPGCGSEYELMIRPVDRETISLLKERCAARGRCRVYFDLAPSGEVHPGILRALLYAQQLSGELAQAGIGCETLIRVNDRAPVRARASAERRNAQSGRRWRDFADLASGKTYPELFRDELDAILRAIGFDARVFDASSIYGDPAFQDLAWDIVDRHRFFPQMRQTVYPVSRATGRMYVTDTIWRDGQLTALCLESRQTQIVSRDFDGGLIGYRLENALMWRHFGIDLDLHAANQSFNYQRQRSRFRTPCSAPSRHRPVSASCGATTARWYRRAAAISCRSSRRC